MGLYENGYSSMRRDRGRGINVGGRWIAKPDEVKTEILQTAGMIKNMDVEFQAAGDKVSDVLRKQWDNFKAEWDEFRKNAKWGGEFFAQNAQMAIRYRGRIEGFRIQLAEATNQPPVKWPMIVTPEKGSIERDKKPFPWRYVLYAGLAIGGAYALSEMMSSGTALRYAIKPKEREPQPPPPPPPTLPPPPPGYCYQRQGDQ